MPNSAKSQGIYWQFILCVLLAMIALVYLWTHVDYSEKEGFEEKGSEFVHLGEDQILLLEALIYPPSDTLLNEKYRKELLKIRNEAVKKFLANEYGNTIVGKQIEIVQDNLENVPNNQVMSYMKSVKFRVRSFFYLTGTGVYVECLFWSLIGVLVSLIYFVSQSVNNKSNNIENDEWGPFDPSKIPSHIAKMFYAPVSTLVLVLGYHYLSVTGDVTADITVNKGLIIFSFISGFYSGRVMRLFNKIKDILLPFGDSKSNAAAISSNTVTVTVGLEIDLSSLPELNNQIENLDWKKDSRVILINSENVEYPLVYNAENSFFTSDRPLPFGRYSLQATNSIAIEEGSEILFGLQTSIEVTASVNRFDLTLIPIVE